MLFPKKVKFRKWHKMRENPKKGGVATRGTEVSFGSFGLKTTSPARIKSNQIEAARKVLSRSTGKTGKVWIRIFPDKPVTKKPAETRQGGGKGAPDHWVAVVKPGRMLFEMAGVGQEAAKEAMRLASHKLPITTRFVVKNSGSTVSSSSENKELVKVEG